MDKRVITYAILFVVLVTVQALLMNHIVLFNRAVCFIFIYFIVKLPLNLNKNLLLTLGFLLGLSVDFMSDTPGVNALSCTILASLKTPVFFAYEQHDDQKRAIEPGMASMGWLTFCKYLLSMSAIYSIIAIFVEFINFSSITNILINVGASTAFTFLVILATDSLLYKK